MYRVERRGWRAPLRHQARLAHRMAATSAQIRRERTKISLSNQEGRGFERFQVAFTSPAATPRGVLSRIIHELELFFFFLLTSGKVCNFVPYYCPDVRGTEHTRYHHSRSNCIVLSLRRPMRLPTLSQDSCVCFETGSFPIRLPLPAHRRRTLTLGPGHLHALQLGSFASLRVFQ